MLEFLQSVLMLTGAVIAVFALMAIGTISFMMLNESAKAVFKHRSDDRFASKLFNKIEEFRNDFA